MEQPTHRALQGKSSPGAGGAPGGGEGAGFLAPRLSGPPLAHNLQRKRIFSLKKIVPVDRAQNLSSILRQNLGSAAGWAGQANKRVPGIPDAPHLHGPKREEDCL
jgi:hypothetical protein